MASKVPSLMTRRSASIGRAFSNSPFEQKRQRQRQLYRFSNGFYSIARPQSNSFIKGIPCTIKLQQFTLGNSTLQHFGFSSSPQPTQEEANRSSTDQANASKKAINDGVDEETENGNSDASSVKKRNRKSAKPTAFSDSDEEAADLSIDDLVVLVKEKEELLKLKHKEVEEMQDKVLRSYAEMENVLDRTKREAEKSKMFAIQNLAKSLLDVADNLGRASSVVKESFSKTETSTDSSGAVPLLKTLLEGVDMTEKQLAEVFKKFGVEKFDPVNEHFDPHRHHALFQIPGGSKKPGTVAVVLKAGYMLHDRIIRPAEVGVTTALTDADDEDRSSEK